MSMLDRLTSFRNVAETIDHVSETLTIAEMADIIEGDQATIDHLSESLADLQLALEDVGWQRLDAWARVQFTREGLRRIAELCRVMSVANPLVRRGLALRTGYVWGGGVEIAARATGPTDDNQAIQDVNAVVQSFLDDRGTRKVLTGARARERNERTVGTDGNLFCALFTKPRVGKVQPRLIPFDEIIEIVHNPHDRSEPWLYKRIHVDTAGLSHTTYHPDVDYRPRSARMVAIGGNPVLWDAPVVHLKVNDLDGWDFGIGDAYAAIAWARAYKEFLEDWAKLVKSLSRFAWRVTSDNKTKAQAAAAKVRTVPSVNARTGEPNDVGATAAMAGVNLEAIPKSGATIDSESGRPLAGMVAAGLEVPVTMLLADPGITGNRATAETLDTPTENMAGLRRDVWGDFLRQVLDYVIDQAVKAPAGPLKGTATWDEWGREVITLDGDTERTIEVNWPDLTETSVDVLMGALEKADGVGVVPDVTMLKLILQALKVKDADEIVEGALDEDGNLIRPDVTAGQAAVDGFRRGEDPAEALR